ncbi:hypothetical protein Sjap_016932 [Stephania japonica]|uniref:Uncharacterized protein n=1 Tax=Stephania japonica TaxID=461633 RepID=A0AAP0I575_9MAGN
MRRFGRLRRQFVMGRSVKEDLVVYLFRRAKPLFGPGSGIGSKWRFGPGDLTLGRGAGRHDPAPWLYDDEDGICGLDDRRYYRSILRSGFSATVQMKLLIPAMLSICVPVYDYRFSLILSDDSLSSLDSRFSFDLICYEQS